MLRDVCQLDYAEIAAILDIPPGTVRSRIARGRAALPQPADREPGTGCRSSNVATMTDPTAPGGPDRTGDTDAAKAADGADPLDELASAYIDGEASPAEVARVDADPELQARVAGLRTVAAAVAQPVHPSRAEVRDAAIAAALAAAPARTARTEPIEVTDLARVRDRRRHGRTRPWALSVAAAVLVALAAIPLLAGLGDDGDNAATVAGEQLTEQADRAEDAADEAAARPVPRPRPRPAR